MSETHSPSGPRPPRAPCGAAFLISVLLLGLGALATPYALFFLGGAALGPTPGRAEAERGEELLRQGQYGPALEQLQRAAAEGYEDGYVQISAAKCLEGLGRLDEADAAFDRAIGDGKWWPPYQEKARFLLRTSGPDAATAWLAALDQDPRDHKFPYLQAEFLCDSVGDRRGAVGFYEEAARRAAARHAFRFDDDGWLLLDGATLQKQNNDYADLWPTLEHLAACRLSLEDLPGALRAATMGVAIGQQLKRCAGFYDAPEIEAGDVACRVLRARVMVRLARLDEADRELEFARVLATRSGSTAYEAAIRTAQRELYEARGR